jgi:peptidoglycan/xylan/chitin deacetylase (PgdA/CDA1 family)
MRERGKYSYTRYGDEAGMAGIRQRLKTAAEVFLCGTGSAALMRLRMAGRTVILAYHNIVPDGEVAVGDLSLHLPRREFARQLEVLARTHDVVPLSAVLSAPRGDARPRAVITFDDATEGTLTAGVDELGRYDFPATIFVPAGFVGGGSFWWDSLVAPGGGVPDEQIRQHALSALRGTDSVVREWAVAEGYGMREVPSHQACGTEAQMQAAARRGIEFGSHTWNHPNLTALSDPDLERELSEPLSWLARLPTAVPWLAYPYGLYDGRVASAARAAGYAGALRVSGGWVPPATDLIDRHVLPRQNIPSGLSIRGFELRVSGLMSR